MNDKVIKFEPSIVGAGHRFDPDAILDEAKGHEFTTVAILAELPDGTLWTSGNANAGETLILMKKAERRIVFGEE
jgi:hypothetical protein